MAIKSFEAMSPGEMKFHLINTHGLSQAFVDGFDIAALPMIHSKLHEQVLHHHST